MLRLRIAAAPKHEQTEMLAQLDRLVLSMKQQARLELVHSAEDDEIESQFDNMPV
ncbi:MAG: hypothetical protein WBC85_09630 [Planktotalea sp.]|uniref:hypothetical protein n=1 Tax=Planktotalea sp. TaxID=2029877 RepID=UPI003C78AEA2